MEHEGEHMIKNMNIAALVLDERLQSRVQINQEVIEEYAHDIEAGDNFPPALVFFDGVHYYLTDGYHRYHAFKKANRASISCEIVNGTFRDAQLHAAGVNAKHGQRRTYADKRKAVMTLLEDFEWQQWSNAKIAQKCGVSTAFVSNLRNSGSAPRPDKVKYTTPTGEVATKVRAPGRKKKVEAPPEPKEDRSGELIDVLTKENQDLSEKLALSQMPGTEEEKNAAANIIAEQRERIRILEIELVAVKASRDAFQTENSQLKKQVAMLNRKIKELT
jgi:hypothetical protein